MVVSLPSSSPARPRRPCEAITIRSHFLPRAVVMIADQGCECVTLKPVAAFKPAAAASLVTTASAALASFSTASLKRLGEASGMYIAASP